MFFNTKKVHELLLNMYIYLYIISAPYLLALGFFAVGQTVRRKKTEPNLIWPNLTETNIFSYGELSHGEVFHGEKSTHGTYYSSS